MAPKRILLVLVCLALCATGGCVIVQPSPKSHPQVPSSAGGHATKMVAWPLAELSQAEGRRVVLAEDDKPVALVSTSHLRAAWSVAQKLLAELPESGAPIVLIAQGQSPNAFAFHHVGKPHVAANLGMLSLLGEDEAAWAALLGHEIAHLQQRHQQVRGDRKSSARTASDLIGMALVVAGIPLGDVVAESAATLVEKSYTRDEEREADRLGLQLMARAGFDPAGAIRLQERLAAAGGGAALPFLSTHPGSAERIETMRTLVLEMEAAAARQAPQ